uniref:Uncharacterized protein n=1 Tax=Anguilla anguilla TaxID=7936 RepID=A0A0E9PNH8_ANGAN
MLTHAHTNPVKSIVPQMKPKQDAFFSCENK